MKKIFFAFFAATALVACKRGSDNVDTPTIPDDNILPKSFTTMSYEEDKHIDTTILTFNYNGNKVSNLERVSGDEKEKITFSYNGDFIISVQDKEDEYEFEYDSNGNLAKEIHTKKHNGNKNIFEITYTINGDIVNAINEVKDMENNGVVNHSSQESLTYTLDNHKQIIKSISNLKRSSVIRNTEDTYTYDNKNSVFKNIAGFKYLSYSNFLRNFIIPSSFNNVTYTYSKETITVLNDSNTEIHGKYENKYTYRYNNKGYPSEISSSYSSDDSTFEKDFDTKIEYNK
ncbi:hypothetical protein [Riemerella columbipharyngis]|uniref:Uncharacterized protein n=1 Tax=Riemerella columbipharyngis TaxID=1071918 RepID=A0A1G7CE44_9FLAO|nr:hypothetical protein [Riemerella columbipharyngis]SDE37654.1 hypothetical protein SAMN05421544_10817 [Riemerella columbipharyngis]